MADNPELQDGLPQNGQAQEQPAADAGNLIHDELQETVGSVVHEANRLDT